MINFHCKADTIASLDRTIDFIKAAYVIRYNSPTREASEGLLLALTNFGARGLRCAYNSVIGYACLDKNLILDIDKADVKFFVQNKETLFEALDSVRIFVAAAVNDNSVMSTDKTECEAATFQLERAAKQLRWLIEAFEDPRW